MRALVIAMSLSERAARLLILGFAAKGGMLRASLTRDNIETAPSLVEALDALDRVITEIQRTDAGTDEAEGRAPDERRCE